MTEFDVISRYFPAQPSPLVDLGIGDDCALLSIPPNEQLAITTDTLIAGRHFPRATRACDIAYKSLAVNVSDLAAMGAKPQWVSLALTLPAIDSTWLTAFSDSFFKGLNDYQLTLIGGDTTRGSLSITITALGLIPKGQALKRSGARVGDAIYVSGTLGDAGLALKSRNKSPSLYLQQRLNRPTPRIALGIALRQLASSAIDVSDGLAQDLQHILSASHVGACVDVRQLPLSAALQTLAPEEAYRLALTAGDDYELCFTVPADKHVLLQKSFATFDVPLTCIGWITQGSGLTLVPEKYQGLNTQGYLHF